jgi:N-hydroxyarylamine O-acetyltransferase
MALDLDAYFARVGRTGPLDPTLETLRALHVAHATSIPFENLDIHLGLQIRLDLESLQAKMVRGRRGGYCFEHNLLFSAVLEAIGLHVTRLAARVLLGRPADAPPLPRTHMVLVVEIDHALWLADVGFGGDGLLLPVPLDSAGGFEAFGRRYRVVGPDDGGIRVLEVRRPAGWFAMYEFTMEPQLPIDYEVANWWTSTHPSSGFVQTLTAQRVSPEGSLTLRARRLAQTDQRGEVIGEQEIGDDDELVVILRERFGLDFPTGTRFRPPTASPPDRSRAPGSGHRPR